MMTLEFMFTRNVHQAKRIKLALQLLPIIVVTIVAVVGASRLQVVQEFLAGASGEPANLIIDSQTVYGPLPQPWRNLAQGGEMSDWRLTPIKGKVVALQPEYIRLDHIYSFYDIVQKNGEQLTYDFSKLDPLVTDILETGAKPYISLSYMPVPISDDNSITGKPQKWEYWQDTVRATIHHFSVERGISNVVYEVWNEPDLFGGWKTYGDKNYLTLYTYAARGASQVQGAKPYQFGGPAVTALYKNWFTKLVEYTQENNLRLDFFSWHRYNTDIDQFRQDNADIMKWQAETPGSENLEFHLTEWGHDSNNHPGYDGNYGAAHTVAVATELPGQIYRAFIFEVEDGKDPAGQTHWGRWGLLTHRDFGSQIKPRYQALRMLNRLQGDQIRVLGKGSWVKALATKNGDEIETIIVNYDRFAKHTEDVPLTFRNVDPGNYTLEITDLAGTTRSVTLSTDTADLQTSILMPVNSVYLTRLIPAK